MSPRRQLVRGLVEADVTVATNAQQLQSDPADPLNRGFIALAFGLKVIGRSVEAVEALEWKTDVIDQVLADESVEARRMRVIDTDELVQRERRRTREIRLPGRRESCELSVHADRRTACGQAEHEVRALTQCVGNALRGGACQLLARRENSDLHRVSDVDRDDDVAPGRCERKRHRTIRGLDLETPDFTSRRHFGQPHRDGGHKGGNALEHAP